MNTRIFIIGVITILYSNMSFTQTEPVYNWPFFNNERGENTGTVGEFRFVSGTGRTQGRYHGGVDLTNGGDRSVYAFNTGDIDYRYVSNDCWNSYVIVGDVKYYHVRRSNAIANETITSIQDDGNDTNNSEYYIGEMFGEGGCPLHVHVEGEPGTANQPINYLNRQLYPFTDETDPEVWDFELGNWAEQNSPNVIEFRQDGHRWDNNTDILSTNVTLGVRDYTIVYGNVDMVIRVRDSQLESDGTHRNGNNAPNSIGYRVLNTANTTVLQQAFSVNFSTVPDDESARFVFDSRSQCCSASYPARYYYIITSDPHNNSDSRWNTSLLLDDKYDIEIIARDIDYEGNSNSSIAHRVPVVVDNFLPYIEQVEVFFGGFRVVNQNWIIDENGRLTYHDDPFDLSNVSQEGETTSIIVTASEPLREDMVLTLECDGVPIAVGEPIISEDGKTFTFTFNLPEGNEATEHCISIQGRDCGGNELLVLPDNPTSVTSIQVPTRDEQGDFPNNVTGTYEAPCFNLAGCLSPGGNINNRNTTAKSMTECEIPTVAFRQELDPFNKCRVQFTDESFIPDGAAVEWLWSFGDGAISREQHPQHTYRESGTFEVTLTLTINGEEYAPVTRTLPIRGCGQDVIPPNYTFSVNISGNVFVTLGQLDELYEAHVSGNPVGDIKYFWEKKVYDGTCSSYEPCYTLREDGSAAAYMDFYSSASCGTGFTTLQVTAIDENGVRAVSDCYVIEVGLYDVGDCSLKLKDIDGDNYTFKVRDPILGISQADVYNCWTWKVMRNGELIENLTMEDVPFKEATFNLSTPGIYTITAAGCERCFDNNVSCGQPCAIEVNVGNVPQIEIINAYTGDQTPIDLTDNSTSDDQKRVWVKINQYPFNDWAGCAQRYTIAWTITNIETGEQTNFVPGDSYSHYDGSQCQGSNSGYFPLGSDEDINGNIMFGFPVSTIFNKCETGTYVVNARIYPAAKSAGSSCCDDAADLNVFYDVPNTIFINNEGLAPDITSMDMSSSACDRSILAEVENACGAISYEWTALDSKTGDVLPGIFSNATSAMPTINQYHSYFDQFEPGATVFLSIELTVTDERGLKDTYSKLLIFTAPVEIEIVTPSNVSACVGTNVSVRPDGPTVLGINNENDYTFKWSLPFDEDVPQILIDNGFDPNVANPTFVMPDIASEGLLLKFEVRIVRNPI